MTFYSELKTASVSTTPFSPLLQYIVYIFAIFMALWPNTSQISQKNTQDAILTLVLLSPDIPCFANSVDPDQLASEEAN